MKELNAKAAEMIAHDKTLDYITWTEGGSKVLRMQVEKDHATRVFHDFSYDGKMFYLYLI